MKILFCERNALMQRDLEETFHRMGIFFRCASYVFADTDHDDYFCSHLEDFLKEDSYDAVFSFNFLPLIAKVCYMRSVPYISWNYDAGWEFQDTSALFYPTNHLFHFDKKACEEYRKSGFCNIFHMPLAVNCHRLDAMQATPAEIARFSSETAFLGSLYEKYLTAQPEIFRLLSPGDAASLTAFADNCGLAFSHVGLWDFMTEEKVTALLPSCGSTHMSRLALITALASMIAGRQRKNLLSGIAADFPLTLYTTSDPSLIPNASFRWRAGYYSEMPYAFRYAAINLNLTIPSIQSGLPLRFFDVLGAGGFLLTNDQEELHEYFRPGLDLDTYSSLEEVKDKLNFYLNHRESAKKIALSGHDIVKKNFSFEGQFTKILKICGLPSPH